MSHTTEPPGVDGPPPDDRALMAAHVGGDPAAFTELVRRHRDRLWAVALRTTGDREEASDALQDALISAYRNAGSYRGDAAVTTWLHRVVVNACLDRLRRRKVRAAVPLPDDAFEGDRTVLVDRRDAIAERETAIEVERALALLPDDQRAAVVLVDLQGWSVADAARMLDCPEGTVKSRCSRGRARLAVTLAHLRNPGAGDGVPSAAPPPGRQPPDPTTPAGGDPRP